MKKSRLVLALTLLAPGLVYAAKPSVVVKPKTPAVTARSGGDVDCERFPDFDKDGHKDLRCGGDDCDDRDPLAFPGHAEVCDSGGRDEDCNPATYGDLDKDKDGFVDNHCRNGSNFGPDCDDSNPALHPGGQICASDSSVYLCAAGKSIVVKCPEDAPHCVHQPNDVGICVPTLK